MIQQKAIKRKKRQKRKKNKLNIVYHTKNTDHDESAKSVHNVGFNKGLFKPSDILHVDNDVLKKTGFDRAAWAPVVED